MATVQLEPGMIYDFSATAYAVGTATIQVIAPPSYTVFINGVEQVTDSFNGALSLYDFVADFAVQIRPRQQNTPVRAGAASSLASNEAAWTVGLGATSNGRSAGVLAIDDVANRPSWSALYTPASLVYHGDSDEVTVYGSGSHSQYVADQAIVDVQTITSTSYSINFYQPSQVSSGSPGTYVFSGKPYITYTVGQGSTANSLKITSDAYSYNDSTSHLSSSSLRTAVTTLTRTGTWPNYTWTMDDWNTSGQAQQTEIVRAPPSGGNSGSTRTETVTVAKPGGATALQSTDIYTQYAWAEVPTSHAAGSSNSVSTAADCYTSSSIPGSYSYPHAVTSTGGNWTAYEYWDASSNYARTGLVKYEYHPFNSSPPNVPTTLDPTQGAVIYRDYAIDPFGGYSRPDTIEDYLNNVPVAKSLFSYTNLSGTYNGQIVVQATRKDFSDSSNYLTTITDYYVENASDPFLRNQLYSIQTPQGTKTIYGYFRHGTYNPSAHTYTYTGTSTDLCSAIVEITGSSSSGAGTSCSSYSGYTASPTPTMDTTYLVSGKSTCSITIRDERALVRRIETYAWTGSAWSSVPVSFTNLDYDYAGHLTDRSSSTGAVWHAEFSGEQKTDEKDEAGVVVNYTYDYAGRGSTVAKSSGPTTTFNYDAASNVTSTVVSGGSESLTSSTAFDDAGRRTSVTVPGRGTTTVGYSYSYTSSGWSMTATAPSPDSGTTVSTYQLDGQLASVTGSAVVPQYYTYGCESGDGRRYTQVNLGTSSSTRKKKSWIDWLGRPNQAETAGYSQSSQSDLFDKNTYDLTTGLLTKTRHTNASDANVLAPTLFTYNALGQLAHTGLDVNNNGTLDTASSDRMSDIDASFENYSSAWWLTETNTNYTVAGDGSKTAVTKKRTRLTGFTGSVESEVQMTDAEGNIADSTTSVNRSTATVTTTVSAPGIANTQSAVVTNGLTTSSTSFDGITVNYSYDGLERPTITSTATRVVGSTNAYWTNTALVETVTDKASNTVLTRDYDNLGRVIDSQDAGSHHTRFAYNTLGQVLKQWGDATYPVSYGYDSNYGDRTTMNTYRAAPPGDSTSWPSVGTADTTIWVFDAASGLLYQKKDAVNNAVQYDYNVLRQAASRKWARTLTGGTPVTTSYSYDSNTGELLTQSYNDSGAAYPTTTITYGTYSRLGQPTTVADDTGTRTFNYTSTSAWRLASVTLPSFYNSRQITMDYETSPSSSAGSFGSYTKGTVAGRLIGFDLGTSGTPAADLHQVATYSNAGQMIGISSGFGGGASTDFIYSWLANSRLVSGYAVSGASFAVSRSYETNRDLLTDITAKWSTNTLTEFAYTSNSLYQRESATINCASSTPFYDYVNGQGYSTITYNYTYNSRGELREAALFGSGAELPGRHFEYSYDSIGNRHASGTVAGFAGADEYTTNALNEYTAKGNNAVHVAGTAHMDANVAVTGAPLTQKTGNAWGAEVVPANATAVSKGSATVYAARPGAGPGGTDNYTSSSVTYLVAPAAQSFSYDNDGNLTDDAIWHYNYDAENRLVEMENVSSAIGTGMIATTDARKLVFVYDYRGRRVEKKVYGGWNGSAYTGSALSDTRYLYDGWNLVAELGSTGTTVTRSYTWGLDVTGDLDAAGGVGGLLQIHDYANAGPGGSSGNTYWPAYDGNGNVAALYNSVSSGAFAVAYEYDPYGNYLRTDKSGSDSVMANNPFRFSTKYADL
ncbi:MAG TPA: hypothetical protein VGM73_03660, partial [Candidatus Didemnitutus sp.]